LFDSLEISDHDLDVMLYKETKMPSELIRKQSLNLIVDNSCHKIKSISEIDE